MRGDLEAYYCLRGRKVKWMVNGVMKVIWEKVTVALLGSYCVISLEKLRKILR